jgi:hypothetical protein
MVRFAITRKFMSGPGKGVKWIVIGKAASEQDALDEAVLICDAG